MTYNYSKLLGRIKEFGLTQKKIAEKLGKDEGTISSKLNNRVGFTQAEIDSICEMLDISNDEIGRYFFAR